MLGLLHCIWNTFSQQSNLHVVFCKQKRKRVSGHDWEKGRKCQVFAVVLIFWLGLFDQTPLPGEAGGNVSTFGSRVALSTTTLTLLAVNWNCNSTRSSPRSGNMPLLHAEFYKMKLQIITGKFCRSF